ncbi:AMP-binding protein [Nocardia otitidiscaviarum]|nr:AMP-binding protein [Nocardia otitidiscaviarum]MCP9618560.1 AMP-binding protein [Nocardia otitidiscaviarum]
MTSPRIAAHLHGFGDRIAAVQHGHEVRYAQLAGSVTEFAERLGTGRRLVALAARNDIGSLVAYLGALEAGCTVLLTETVTAELIDSYDPDVVITATADGSTPDPLVRRDGSAHTLHPELALLLSTSGSTGSPKLVRLSYTNVLSNAAAIAEYLEIEPTDRAATTLPLFYCYGLSVVHSYLLRGASLLLTSRSVVEPEFWDEFGAQRATSFAAVPYTIDLLDRIGFERMSLPHLRYVTQAGGRLAPERVAAYARLGVRRGFRFYVMYGQTEATARMAYLPPDLATSHPDCIGVPVPGGSFTLEPVDEGGHELVYHGPNVMLGYAESPADLALGPTHPALRTGDLACRTEDGLYRVIGRRSRFAKIYGLRIDLQRIESGLAAAGFTTCCTEDGEALVVAVESAAPTGTDSASTEPTGPADPTARPTGSEVTTAHRTGGPVADTTSASVKVADATLSSVDIADTTSAGMQVATATPAGMDVANGKPAGTDDANRNPAGEIAGYSASASAARGTATSAAIPVRHTTSILTLLRGTACGAYPLGRHVSSRGSAGHAGVPDAGMENAGGIHRESAVRDEAAGPHDAAVAREAARLSGLPVAAVRVCVVPSIPRLPNGKPDYPSIRRLPGAPGEASPPGPHGESSTDVRTLFAHALGLDRDHIGSHATFADLGGDSLTFVTLAVRLERALGQLPADWPSRTIAELEALPRRRTRFGRSLDTSTLLRAIGIVTVIGSHIGLFVLWGGAHVLLAAAGFNFARFAVTAAPAAPRLRRTLRSAAFIAVPTAAWVLLTLLVSDYYGWQNVLLLNKILGPHDSPTAGHLWFIEVVLYLIVAAALLLRLPLADRWERLSPFWFATGLLAVALIFRYRTFDLYRPEDVPFSPLVAWFFVLGWAAAKAETVWHRLLLSAIALATVPGYFGETDRERMILAGILLLVWLPSVRVPAVVAGAAALLADASLFAYLLHWQVYPLFGQYHLAALAASLAAGWAAARLLSWARTGWASAGIGRNAAVGRRSAVDRPDLGGRLLGQLRDQYVARNRLTGKVIE